MDGEIWRDAPSLPGILVSNEGRAMYVPHRKPMPHGGERAYGGQPTLGVWAKDQYRYIIIVHGHTYKVHRLVCEAFHGPPPFDRAVAMHVDEDAENNRASNLRWGTQKENLNATRFINYCRTRTGGDNPGVRKRREEGRRSQSREGGP